MIITFLGSGVEKRIITWDFRRVGKKEGFKAVFSGKERIVLADSEQLEKVFS